MFISRSIFKLLLNSIRFQYDYSGEFFNLKKKNEKQCTKKAHIETNICVASPNCPCIKTK